MDVSKQIIDFNSEFQLYYPILINKVIFLVGDRNIADDIVQETLIKYYYADKTKINNSRAWLIKVAVNLSYNYLRSEKNRRKREEVIIPENANTVEEKVIQVEKSQYVREALSKIPERDQLLILLKYTGHSYNEIAQIIEVEGSSVGTLLARAKRRFKEALMSLKGSEFYALK